MNSKRRQYDVFDSVIIISSSQASDCSASDSDSGKHRSSAALWFPSKELVARKRRKLVVNIVLKNLAYDL
jgi:hypothetical protein